jgi:Zn-dependent protease
MDFHDISEYTQVDHMPTMGMMTSLLTVAPPIRQFAQRLTQGFGILNIPVYLLILAALHIVLIPLQILVVVLVLIPIRILSGKGNFADNLTKWVFAASPLAAFAIYFGPSQLLAFIKPYFFWLG